MSVHEFRAALTVASVLVVSSIAAVVAATDCVLPGDSWELELESVDAVDGTTDVAEERTRLGINARLAGGFRDRMHPRELKRVWLQSVGPEDSGAAPSWQLSLIGK